MNFEQCKELVNKYGSNWPEHYGEFEKKQSVKKGDIFYTSWGYDQTNYDYIVVIETSKTGKTAICKRAEHENIGYSHLCNEQKPLKKPFGKSFRMKIDKRYNTNEPVLRGSYIFCGNEESESKRFDCFYPVTSGQTFYETDPQFGH